MDSGTNETPVEIIKEEAFGGTYFRDIYSYINDKWYKNSCKEFDVLKILIKSIIVQIIMMSVSINMVLNVVYHQDFGRMKDGSINKIHMDGFNGISDIG